MLPHLHTLLHNPGTPPNAIASTVNDIQRSLGAHDWQSPLKYEQSHENDSFDVDGCGGMLNDTRSEIDLILDDRSSTLQPARTETPFSCSSFKAVAEDIYGSHAEALEIAIAPSSSTSVRSRTLVKGEVTWQSSSQMGLENRPH